jgi:hypothetical protein
VKIKILQECWQIEYELKATVEHLLDGTPNFKQLRTQDELDKEMCVSFTSFALV